jgi:hypothetical protein
MFGDVVAAHREGMPGKGRGGDQVLQHAASAAMPTGVVEHQYRAAVGDGVNQPTTASEGRITAVGGQLRMVGGQYCRRARARPGELRRAARTIPTFAGEAWARKCRSHSAIGWNG